MSEPAAESEFPGSQPPSLEERPGLADEDVAHEPALEAGLDRPKRRAVATGREAAGVAMRERRGAFVEKGCGVVAHAPAALDLGAMEITGPLGEVAVRLAHLLHGPRKVDRGRARGDQYLRRLVEVLASTRGERVAVRGGDADCRGAANDHRPDRIGDFGRRAAFDLHLLVGKAPLVEEDDAVVLQAHDLLRAKIDRPAREPRSHDREVKCPRPKKPGTSPAPR
jgi:hypothetical protein